MSTKIQIAALGNYLAASPYANIIPLLTTEDYTAVTTAGFLNRVIRNTGQQVQSGDLINAYYNYQSNGSGTNAFFTVSIDTDHVITLTPFSNPNEVTFIGTPIIGNFPVIVDLAGNMGDSGVAVDEILQCAVVAPDENINNIIVNSGSINNTAINAGAILFTPAASKLYIIQQAILTIVTSFAGGSTDADLKINVGSDTYATAPSATIKAAALNYLLGGAGFVYSISGNNVISTGSPLRVPATSSDYTSGAATISFVLQRVS